MDNKKDYIDKLYSDKLGKFESDVSNNDWSQLSTKLGKTNFLKFSFATFNIFFVGIIVSFAAAGIYLGVTNIRLSNKIEILEDKIEVQQDQKKKNDIKPLLQDTSYIEESLIYEQEKETDVEITNIKPIEKNIEKKDSLTLPKHNTSSVKPKKVIRRIKKQVIIKQKDVIIKDTVTMRKKRIK